MSNIETPAPTHQGEPGPVETLVLDACGHAPHMDQRDAVMDAAVAWLQQLRTSR